MKIISIINLKGGVAKTISSINIAHILATVYNKKILLIDNDKQGNTSKFFSLGNEEELSIADIMLNRDISIKEVIGATQYENIDLIKANMSLLQANLTIKKSDILKQALEEVSKDYDYCIIDNAPDINLSTINAIVASNDILIPVKADVFALDGLKEINEQINNAKQVNPNLILKGCFITQWQKNNANMQTETLLIKEKYPIFKTHIRRTPKIDESTFENKPILEYSKRCGATRDYLALVEEYLN